MLLMALLLVSCQEKAISDNRIVLGTICSIELRGTDDEALLSSAFDILYECDRKISRFDEGSYVYQINRNAGIAPVSVPEDVYSLIRRTVGFADETGGVFNPAIGPLSSLWGIGTENARVPDSAEIEALLPLLDWRKIILSDEDMSVFLPEKGMALDLGGAGKGWAGNAVRDYLEENGVESAFINLGGNVIVIGDNGDRPWRVGIQTPGEERGAYFHVMELEDEALVTSGGYQRFLIEDGKAYHHILSSETGYPAETDLLSASVAGRDGLLLDMMSTALFASGSEGALELAERYGLKAVLLTEDLETIGTA